MLTPPAVEGQTVRLIKVHLDDYAWLEGAEFILQSNTANGIVYVPGQGFISCIEWEIVVPEPHPDRYTMPDSTADMAAELAQLRIDLATATRDRDYLQVQNRTMWDDFAKINDALGEEASDRDWCEDYEVFVKAVNARMQTFSLDLPTIEYQVTVRRTRTVYDEVTVIVEGKRGISEYDLQDAAFEEAGMSYDWHEVDDDVSDDYEITDMQEA